MIELDHHCVDHDEIADRILPVAHSDRAHQHGGGQAGGENDRLSGVENRKRGVGFDAGLLVALHRAVVARGFAFFGAEIFDRFVVQKRIDRLGVRLGVGIIHGPANLNPPFGRNVGVIHVNHDRDHGREDIAPVELPQQHGHQQRNLDDGRNQLQDHHAHNNFDAGAATLQHPGQSAGLALEVKAQRQFMHVHESAIGELADRMHGYAGKQPVALLGENRHQHAHRAVA